MANYRLRIGFSVGYVLNAEAGYYTILGQTTDLTKTNLGSLFRWDASSGATSYTLKWGTSSGSYTSSQSVGNVTTYDPNNLSLTPGQIYYVAVFADNTNGQSTASNEIQVQNGLQIGP